MKKVNVIVIIKNTKEYLKKCIDSLVNQSYSEIKIIIIDDNSKEKSDDIISQYDSNIVNYYFYNEELGPGGARNKGIELADAEYICFVDSDDWVDLNYIEEGVKMMDRYKADIALFGLIREYDIPLKKPIYKCKYDRIYKLDNKTAFNILTDVYNVNIAVNTSAANKMYRLDFIQQNNLTFPINVFYEDVLFGIKCILESQLIICIPDTFYHHYKRMGSIIQSLTDKHFTDFEKTFISVKKYLTSENLYPEFSLNYQMLLERYYNLLVKQIFEFSNNEHEKKIFLKKSISTLSRLIDVDEYFKNTSSEKIRRHLQPDITDTTIY